MFEYGGQCYAITRGNPDGSPPAAEDMAAREQVLVAVYEKPTQGLLPRLKENPPAPVASVAPFGVLSAGERDWVVGIEGPYAGWLAMRGKDAAGHERLLGVPTSTCALWHGVARNGGINKRQVTDAQVEPAPEETCGIPFDCRPFQGQEYPSSQEPPAGINLPSRYHEVDEPNRRGHPGRCLRLKNSVLYGASNHRLAIRRAVNLDITDEVEIALQPRKLQGTWDGQLIEPCRNFDDVRSW